MNRTELRSSKNAGKRESLRNRKNRRQKDGGGDTISGNRELRGETEGKKKINKTTTIATQKPHKLDGKHKTGRRDRQLKQFKARKRAREETLTRHNLI